MLNRSWVSDVVKLCAALVGFVLPMAAHNTLHARWYPSQACFGAGTLCSRAKSQIKQGMTAAWLYYDGQALSCSERTPFSASSTQTMPAARLREAHKLEDLTLVECTDSAHASDWSINSSASRQEDGRVLCMQSCVMVRYIYRQSDEADRLTKRLRVTLDQKRTTSLDSVYLQGDLQS